MFKYAIVRTPGENCAAGLTTANLGQPDYALLLEQHQAYIAALRNLGLEVVVLEPLPDYPDAYFVEDVAVVTAEVAIITIPGAKARNGEQESMQPILARFRPIVYIQPPGTLDGGDVMQVDRHLFIGISQRTNLEGAAQLGRILQGYGYTFTPVTVDNGLHLKSSVNYIGRNTLLLGESFAGRTEFDGFARIIVSEEEAHAANTLLINNVLLTPRGYPDTRRRLLAAGFELLELDTSEIKKMDGGLSCLSLRF